MHLLQQKESESHCCVTSLPSLSGTYLKVSYQHLNLLSLNPAKPVTNEPGKGIELTCALQVQLLECCFDVSQHCTVCSNVVCNLAQRNLFEAAVCAKPL